MIMVRDDRTAGDDLLTTRDVAALMGVGPTTVKRWADAGLLPCLKTAGRHRRFARAQVTRFAEAQGALEAEASGAPLDLDEWVELLRGGQHLHEVEARLMGERRRHGAWWKAAQSVAAVLVELGARWSAGRIGVLDEHLASEQLRRALDRCAEGIVPPPNARRCLLAAVEREEHVLGLSLAELVAREAGWATLRAGTHAPAGELAAWARHHASELIALSASGTSMTEEQLRAVVDEVGAAAAVSGVRLVLGGEGPWPAQHPLATRVRSFEAFHRLLVS